MNSDISRIIDSKANEFQEMGKRGKEEIFGELCFCLLTANTSAEMGIRTQNLIGLEGFITYDQNFLSEELKRIKYRFYNVRSNFIVQARWIIDELPGLLRSNKRDEVREYLVENVKGIGYKEASHFLRNVGIFNFAILDKHIMRMLSEEYKFQVPKAVLRKDYYKNEKIVAALSEKVSLEPGIFDLYMWKIATGKIIK
ncbi:hypothetical protein IX51_04150 [uncultured archaeon]|nr:hypothetical protein IX51_04150 [uncultured archaeon]